MRVTVTMTVCLVVLGIVAVASRSPASRATRGPAGGDADPEERRRDLLYPGARTTAPGGARAAAGDQRRVPPPVGVPPQGSDYFAQRIAPGKLPEGVTTGRRMRDGEADMPGWVDPSALAEARRRPNQPPLENVSGGVKIFQPGSGDGTNQPTDPGKPELQTPVGDDEKNKPK